MPSSEMPAGVIPERPAGESTHSSRVLTRWSWAMIPATMLSMAAAFLVGNVLMAATGTDEGALLTTAGVAGWLAWLAVILTMLSAPLIGVLLGYVASRRTRDGTATLPLLLNAAVAATFTFLALLNLIGGLVS